MEHDYLIRLRSSHPALRFLGADNLALIASFFNLFFVKPNRRSIPHGELVARLDDYLYGLRKIYGETAYPRSGREYVEDWAVSQTSYLRKYYVSRSDEPECDMTPEVEKALDWLRILTDEKSFVGTESRLLTLFEILRDLVQQSERDPKARIAILEKQKKEINAELAKARSGIIENLNATQVKERFFEAEETAQK
jgi:hypothetical protein